MTVELRWSTVWAMISKEFRELRRDRRTVAMMVVLPIVLLVVFGYAANFRVSDIPAVVVGPGASQAAAMLREPTFRVIEVDPAAGESVARARLRDGKAVVAVVAGSGAPLILMDGSQLFSVQTAEAALGKVASGAGVSPRVEILYNKDLSTSWVMVPGLAGLILVFIGTLITSLGVVRERQAGTLEQLAVMPLRPWDVIAGKIAPYLMMAAIDLVLVDLVMPNMSGRELTEQIRKIAPRTRILWCSGYVRSPDSQEAERYLQKPFTSQDLLRKVKQVLSE